MTKKQENDKELFIDLRQIFTALLHRAWLIVIVGLVAGIAMFVYTSFFVAPKYSSSVMLYVNNKAISMDDITISASDLSASQSLIDTYIVILKNRTTMEEVAEKSGLPYRYDQLMGMVSTQKVEGTEVFKVTVTTEDPYEAAHIANCISEVLPLRIEEIIDGSSMRIVDSAVVNTGKVSPNISSDTIKAFAIAVFLAAAAIVLLAIIDDTIRTEDQISRNYDLPILAIIPDFDEKNKSSYYYRNGNRYEYGYGKKSSDKR